MRGCPRIMSGLVPLAALVWCGQAAAQAPAGAPPALGDFEAKVLIALVSAALSLLGGFILILVKDRREPQKRISYDLKFMEGRFGVEEAIAKHVELTYKGSRVEDLTYVHCAIKNSGKLVVKDQFLRFTFPTDCRVLDAYAEPPPPREFGVSQVMDDEPLANERRFKFQHLERQQAFELAFVVSGRPANNISIVPYNEAGGVEVVAASISKAADDRKAVELFVVLFACTIFLPPLVRWLPGWFHDTAVSVLYLIIAAGAVSTFRPFARTVAAALFALAKPAATGMSISYVDQKPGAGFYVVSGNGSIVVNPAQLGSESGASLPADKRLSNDDHDDG